MIRAWKESTVSEKRGSRVKGLSGASRRDRAKKRD